MKKLFFIVFLFFSSQLFGQGLKTIIDNNIVGQGNRGITAVKLKNALYSVVDSMIAIKNRNTHNGSQSISTISHLQDSLSAKLNFSVLDENYMKTDGYIENKKDMLYFLTKIYDYNTTPANKRIGIAWYGDSVSGTVAGEFVKGLTNYPLSNYSYPEGIASIIPFTITGVAKYQGVGSQNVNQTIFDGKTSATITRSGSTATVTTAVPHKLTNGKYVTIAGASQSEYNGTFLVVSVPNSTTLTYTINGSPSTPATGIISVYGGIADFTYLSNAQHIELANGAVCLFDGGQSYGFSNYEVYFAKTNDSGSAFVEFLAENGTVISSQTVSLSNATTTATKVSFAASSKHKIRITATNKVVILGCYALKSDGIVAINFGLGGTSLAQNNYSNDAIFDYMITNLNVNLFFVMCKEETNNFQTNLATRLNRQTTMSRIILASLPDVSTASGQIANNKRFRDFANSNGYTFVDSYKYVGDYSNVVRANQQGDGTHVLQFANRVVADYLISEFNVNNSAGVSVRQGINQTNTSITDNIFTKISIQNPTNYSSIPVISNMGGANTNLAIINNIGQYRMGAGANYSYLGGYTTEGVGVFNNLGWGDLYSRSIITGQGRQSSFDGFTINGTSGLLTQNNSTPIVFQATGGINLRSVTGQNHFSVAATTGNVGIGTGTAAVSAALDIPSTTKGVLIPRMTTTERNAILGPATWLQIICTDCTANDGSTGVPQTWNGSTWKNSY